MTCPYKNFEFHFFLLHISLHQLGVEHTEILSRLCVWTSKNRNYVRVQLPVSQYNNISTLRCGYFKRQSEA